jgi:hypothetical protein
MGEEDAMPARDLPIPNNLIQFNCLLRVTVCRVGAGWHY